MGGHENKRDSQDQADGPHRLLWEEIAEPRWQLRDQRDMKNRGRGRNDQNDATACVARELKAHGLAPCERPAAHVGRALGKYLYEVQKTLLAGFFFGAPKPHFR